MISGRHVLFMMLAFFGVIITVNVVFITLAVGSFSGEEEPKSYRQGLDYNAVLESRARQTALGWSASLEASADRVVITVYDSGGVPVRGLSFSGEARHPADMALDRPLVFTAQPDGSYVARLDRTLSEGGWTVAAADESAPFALERRIWIR